MAKTSDSIKQFLDFIRECEPRYLMALEIVKTEEKRTQDFLHAIEFEPHAEERSKIATKMRASRIERRENKDIVEELEPIIEFMADRTNKKVIDQLSQLLGRVRKVEKYHENRSYYPRIEK
ncbi:MAG: hypothetical protein IKM88_05380 [Lachnospiraceae bacterium]|nr:hypothetical protein [Lachnospiraceae bacterium]